MVGQGRLDPDTREVRELVGYFVDITTALRAQAGEAASAAIRASAVSRAGIEQAKGIIAFVLNIDVEEAFEHLRRASNETNVAVREIARQVVEAASVKKLSATDIANVLAAPPMPMT
jgi:hypothetical protein